MRLAFALFKYFPYGGLQRDCIKIAEECLKRGHQVDLYALESEGKVPNALSLTCLPVKGWMNYQRYRQFALELKIKVEQVGYDGVVGFNKMAGLDLYYAADSCYAAKVCQRAPIYRFLPRTRSFLEAEKAVFSSHSKTHVMMISAAEKAVFQKFYTICQNRITLLPPGIQKDRLKPADYEDLRVQKRAELCLDDETRLLLMVGSGFRTKGVDRSLRAISSLPENLKNRVHLYIVGHDNPRPFERLARKLMIADRVNFLGGRDDVPELLFAADLLLHPAYRENTGTVLLEAMAAGLPQLVTEVCGYSFHIRNAQSGYVMNEPFDQCEMNAVLLKTLEDGDMALWRQNAEAYISENDLLSMPQCAVDTIEEVLSC